MRLIPAKADSPSYMLLGRAAAAGMALVSSPVIGRAIGPDGRGETAAAIALFLLVPVLLSLGLPLEVRRRAAIGQGADAIRSARAIAIISSLPAFLIAGICHFTIFEGFSSEARAIATFGICLTPLTFSWICDLSYLIAHQRFRDVFALQMVQPALFTVLVLTAWISGLATTATVLSANLVGFVATFFIGLRLTGVKLKGSRMNLREIWRDSLGYAGSSVAESASFRLDQILVLPLIGAYQAGLYSVAATIAVIPVAIGQALGAAFFTPIARATKSERGAIQAEATRAGFTLALFSIPPTILLSAIGIPIAFGSDFSGSVPVAAIALVGSGLLLVAYVVSMALAADQKGGRMTAAQSLSLAVAIGLLLVLGPPLGAIGAAIASSLGYLLLLVILLAGLGMRPAQIRPAFSDFRNGIQVLMKNRPTPQPDDGQPSQVPE